MIGIARRLAQTFCGLNQHLIAELMIVPVVGLLKMVEVEKEKRETFGIKAGAVNAGFYNAYKIVFLSANARYPLIDITAVT